MSKYRITLTKLAEQRGIASSETASFLYQVLSTVGTAVAQWLRCCATNRKVAGSIPEVVTGIFH